MSHAATKWAFRIKLPHLQKHVLTALAFRHNHKTGRCDPSIQRLADDTGMSADSVRRNIKQLAEAGHLEIIRRRKGAVQLRNRYVLNMSEGVLAASEYLPAASEGVLAASTDGTCPQPEGVLAASESKGETENGKERKTSPGGVKVVCLIT